MADDISVLIITRNRSGGLKQCLESLVYQSRKPAEVIIVDNGSSDDTKEAAFRYSGLLPIKYIYEQTPSIPHARNTALKNSASGLALFIDDDCAADPHLLEEMLKARSLYREALFIQGRIRGHASTWCGYAFKINSEAYFDCYYYADKGSRAMRYLWTANVAVNADKVRAAEFYFDQTLGRSSDRELGFRVTQAGHSIVYYPDMCVTHNYDGARLIPLMRRFFRNARAGVWLLRKTTARKERNVSLFRFFFKIIKKTFSEESLSIASKAGVIVLNLFFLSASGLGFIYYFFRK